MSEHNYWQRIQHLLTPEQTGTSNQPESSHRTPSITHPEVEIIDQSSQTIIRTIPNRPEMLTAPFRLQSSQMFLPRNENDQEDPFNTRKRPRIHSYYPITHESDLNTRSQELKLLPPHSENGLYLNEYQMGYGMLPHPHMLNPGLMMPKIPYITYNNPEPIRNIGMPDFYPSLPTYSYSNQIPPPIPHSPNWSLQTPISGITFALLQQPSARQTRSKNNTLSPDPIVVVPREPVPGVAQPKITGGICEVWIVCKDGHKIPAEKDTKLCAKGGSNNLIQLFQDGKFTFSLQILGKSPGCMISLEFGIKYTLEGSNKEFTQTLKSNPFVIYAPKSNSSPLGKVEGINPATAESNSETEVWIKGRHFPEGEVEVLVDGIPASVREVLPNLITAVIPPRNDIFEDKVVDVVVRVQGTPLEGKISLRFKAKDLDKNTGSSNVTFYEAT